MADSAQMAQRDALTALALVAYPLSREFRERLERWAEQPVSFVTVAELRRSGPRAAWRRLRAERWTHVLIPLEDPASSAVAPILVTVALAAYPALVSIVDLELRQTAVPRTRAVAGLAALAAATVDAQRAVRRAERETVALLRAARLTTRVESRSLLYLNANLWFGVKAGGSVAHVAGVVNGFAALGFDVEVAAPERPPLVRSDLPFRRLQVPHAFGFPVEANHIRFSQTVARTDLARPGFLYQRMSTLNYAGAQLARRLRVPLVLEYNGSEAWIARHWGRALRYDDLAVRTEQVSLRHAALVVTVSEVLRADLLDRGVDESRIIVHPNGVDVKAFDPAQRDPAARLELGIPENAVLATFVGTFGEWHGVDVLARAIGELFRSDPDRLRRSRLHFLLIGDGLKMADVRRLLKDVPPELVTVTGLVPQAVTPRYLSASDIAVSPHVPNADGTPFFGSPTKLFEYMAAGTAIVASDLDQIGTVLQPALRTEALPDTGPVPDDPSVALLSEPGSVAGLVAGIQFLAEHPDWRAQLGRQARTRAVARHTWEAHVLAIEERLPS